MFEFVSNPRRWARMTVLLSRDGTVPFYGMMGLDLENPSIFCNALRSVVRRELSQHPHAVTPASFVPQVLKEIEKSCGDKLGDEFRDWATYVYQDIPADHPHGFAWSSIMRRCVADSTIWSRLGLPADKSRALQMEYSKATSEADIAEIEAQVRAEPVSEWDRDMIARFTMFSEETPPSLWIVGTIRFRRSQIALRDLFDELSEEEVRVFRQSIQSIAQADQLTSLSELKDPRGLKEPA